MTNTRLERASIVLAAAATLAGCDIVVNGIEGWEARARATETWTRTYELSANGRVEITNVNGRVTVTGTDGSRVEVKAEKIAKAETEGAAKEALAELEIVESAQADRVSLSTKQPRGWSRRGYEVRYQVRVPRGASVRLQNTNGGIEVDGISGAVVARTTNGGVQGRRLANAVEAQATNGGVRVDLDSLSQGPIELQTTNGGVELRIPENAKADIVATCTNGGIGVTGLRMDEIEKSRRRFEGRLNGGGVRVRLQTTNGGIRIGAT